MTTSGTTISCGARRRRTVLCRLAAPLALACLGALAAAGGPAPVRADEAPPSLFPLDERWTAPVDGLPSAPPVVSGDRVVVAVAKAGLDAFAAGDGTAAWSAPVATTRPLAVGDGMVFAATATGVTAVDLARGTVAWRAEIGEPAAPPCWHAGWVVAGTADGRLVAMRGTDGGVIWTRELGGTPSAAAAIEGNRVYVPLADGRVRALAIQDGAPVWEVRLRQAGTGILPRSDRVYVGSIDNQFYCLRARDGRPLWAWRTGSDVIGAGIVDASRVFLVSRDNVLYALDRRSGVQQWRRALPTRPLGPPSVRGGRVLVPLENTALPFYAADGKAAEVTVGLPANLLAASALDAGGGSLVVALVTVDPDGAVVLRALGSGTLARLAPLDVLEALPGTEVGLPGTGDAAPGTKHPAPGTGAETRAHVS